MNVARVVSASLHDPLGYLVVLYLLGIALSGAGAVLLEPLRRLRGGWTHPGPSPSRH